MIVMNDNHNNLIVIVKIGIAGNSNRNKLEKCSNHHIVILIRIE